MASSNDMKDSTETYNGFISALKWSTPVIALITLVVVVMIAT